MKTKQEKPLSLVWLRRDLRLDDHAPLAKALSEKQDIQPVFVFDTDILERFHNKHDRRLSFLAATLYRMHQQLAKQGGGLLVLKGSARLVVPRLAEVLEVQYVVAGADYEPQTRERDRVVSEVLEEQGRKMIRVKEHVLHAPYEILKSDKTPYKVFTPYSKAWRQSLDQYSFAEHKVRLKERLYSYEYARRKARESGLEVLDIGRGVRSIMGDVGMKP